MSNPNRLAKAGAHMRWFLESNGIDPESVFISIGFQNEQDLAAFGHSVRKDADGKIVRIPFGAHDTIVMTHGIHIIGCVTREKKEQKA